MLIVRRFSWKNLQDNSFAIDIYIVPEGKVFHLTHTHFLMVAGANQTVVSAAIAIINKVSPPPPLEQYARLRSFNWAGLNLQRSDLNGCQSPDAKHDLWMLPGEVLEVQFNFSSGSAANYAEASCCGYLEPLGESVAA